MFDFIKNFIKNCYPPFPSKRKQPTWLELEMAKPRSAIVIVLNDGQEIETDVVDPVDLGNSGFGDNFTITSLELAKSRIETSYERGFFKSKNDVTYPVHSVQRAFIKTKI